MTDLIDIELTGRDDSSGESLSLHTPATLASLRAQLEDEARMADSDVFDLTPPKVGEDAEEPKPRRVPKAEEAEAGLESGCKVAVKGVARRVTVTIGAAAPRRLFMDPGAPLSDLRAQLGAAMKADDRFVADGRQIPLEDEKRRIRSFDAAEFMVRAVGLALVVRGLERDARRFSWAAGAPTETLKALRAFIEGQTYVTAKRFLVGGDLLPPSEEDLTTVEEAADEKNGVLWIGMKDPNEEAAAAKGGEDEPRFSSRDPAAKSERITLNDRLGELLGGGAATDAPRHNWRDLPETVQRDLRESFRLYEGLRFAATDDQGLDLVRSGRAALRPRPNTPLPTSVQPPTNTRFAAFASLYRTSDYLKSHLAWNVGGTAKYEAKTWGVEASADYQEAQTKERDNQAARLYLRVEFHVARGLLTLHPDQVEPAPELLAAIAAVRKLPAKAQPAGLCDLLHDYGPYVALAAPYGGKLIYTQERTAASKQEREDSFRKFVSSVKGSYKGFSGSAKGGFESETNLRNDLEVEGQSIDVTSAGGNPAAALAPYQWAHSVDYYPWWNVIGYADIRPVLTFLDPDTVSWARQTLLQVAENDRFVAWGSYKASLDRFAERQHRADSDYE